MEDSFSGQKKKDNEFVQETAMNRLQFSTNLYGGFSNKKASGSLPSPLPKPLRLNLGCGMDVRPDFVNIDIFSEDPDVVFMDIRKLDLPDNVADQILASDILEHFSHRETDFLLKEWARVLKPGGEMIIRCPSLALQVKAYQNGVWNADVASYMIFGGQTNPGDYHCAAYDSESIKQHLFRAGLEVVLFDEVDTPQDKGFINLNMVVIAKKPLPSKMNIHFQPALDFEATEKPKEVGLFDINDLEELQENEDNTLPEEDIQQLNEVTELVEQEYLPAEMDESFVETKEPIIETEETLVEDGSPISEIESSFVETEAHLVDDFDFDFDIDNISPEVFQKINNETFSFDMLEEIVAMDKEQKEEKPQETHETAQGKHLNVIWEGSQFVYHSLALINREHCSNILKTGLVELTIVPYEEENIDTQESEKYLRLKENDVRYKTEPPEEVANLPYLWIRHQWPPKNEPPRGAKWVIMQPWEYSCLPESFAELFKQADEIWTPSTYSRNSMLRSGIPFNKVQVIPNGINPDLFKPNGEIYHLETGKKLKFLFVGGTIFRKGIDILLESYLKAFTANDEVCLVIKDMGGDSFYKGQTAKRTIENIKNDRNVPEIIYIDRNLSEEQMASLYRACDVFVSSYRGEGFSLPALEAMACGLPLIVTDGGATEDFITDDFAIKIPSTKLSVGKTIDGMEMTEEAFLLEPDGSQLVEILQQIYIHASKIKNMGIKAMHTARTLWTWNKATLMLLSRIDLLYGKSLAIKAEEELRDEEDSNIIMARGEMEFEKGNFNEAVELLHLALEKDDLPDLYKVHSHNRLAFIYLSNKDFSRANQSIQRAKEIIPGNPDSDYLLAKIYCEQEKWTDMLEVITKVFDNWKDNKYISTIGINLDDLLCDTAFAFHKDGDIDGALQLYTEALKINNVNGRACYGAGLCFKDAGAIDEARTMLEWAVKLEPDNETIKKELDRIF